MSYIVVLEYKKGGAKGIRTWTTYADKNAFQKTFNPESTTVLAENVDSKTAMDMTALTPPAARFLASIDEASYDDGNVDLLYLISILHNALYAIDGDQGRMCMNNLTYKDAYVPEDFSGENEVAIIFKTKIISMILDEYGRVNQDEVLDTLERMIQLMK